MLGCVGHLFSIICRFWLLLLASCVLYYVLCVCSLVCWFICVVCRFVVYVTCCLWVDRVIVRVCVRSKLGVDGLKEMDGYMDEWMSG